MMQCGGFGYYIFGGKGGHYFYHIKITYAPPPFLGGGGFVASNFLLTIFLELPLVSCSADGFHSVANDQGPTLINSLFEGLQVDF